MDLAQGVRRLKVQGQLAKGIVLALLIAGTTSISVAQSAPRKKSTQAQAVPVQTQVTSGAATPKPDIANFTVLGDYVEALINWTIDQRVVTTGKQVTLNVAPAPTPGRYQIVFNPSIRADTFLLDTQTGKVWVRTQITDIVGDPDVWKAQDRVDNEFEFIEWAKRHTSSTSASRNALKRALITSPPGRSGTLRPARLL